MVRDRLFVIRHHKQSEWRASGERGIQTPPGHSCAHGADVLLCWCFCSFGDFLSTNESVASVFGAGDTISPLLSITMATGEALKHWAQPCWILGLLFHREMDVIRALNVCELGRPRTFGSMAGFKVRQPAK